DAARDAYDSVNIPDGILSDSGFSDIRQDLLTKAERDGFDIEEKYTAVREAATQINLEKLYKFTNKTFSKFAHPTALSVLSYPSPTEPALRDKLYKIGIAI